MIRRQLLLVLLTSVLAMLLQPLAIGSAKTSYRYDLATSNASARTTAAVLVTAPTRTKGQLSANIAVNRLCTSSCPARSIVGAEAGPDFVAGPIGSEPPVPVSQSRMAAGFDEAGFPSTPTASPGVEYTLPDGTKVRLMEPSGQAPMRASFTNANGGPINPFTGKPVQPPAPPGWSMKDWVRALTHVEQTP